LSPDEGGDDSPAFLRGLALGALVGAAIAGSTLWSRWREHQARGAADVESAHPGDEPS